MKYSIAAGCAYYGGADPRHLAGTRGFLREQVPFIAIKGCAYPEMARSHITGQAMEFAADCMIVVDPDVAFDASEARRLAEYALKKRAIVSATIGSLRSGPVRRVIGAAEPGSHVALRAEPWTPERANDLAFSAIPVEALRAMAVLEDRQYTNTPIKQSEKSKWNRPFFSPWKRNQGTLDTVPIGEGVYCNPDRAFLLRAQQAGVPVVADRSFRHGLLSSPGYSVRVHRGDQNLRDHHGIANFAICVPTFGALDLEQQEQLFELEKAGCSIVEIHNCPYIDLARAELTRLAVNDLEAEGVFFLDHDIAFRPIDAISLMREARERRDVVAAVYCMRKSAHSLIGAPDESCTDPLIFFEGGGIRPALYSGLGFAAIPIEVIEKLCTSHPALDGGFPEDVHPIYALDVNGGYYAGEDVSFCSRVQGLDVRHFVGAGGDDWELRRRGESPTGHQVMLDTRVRIFHKGSYSYGIEDHGNVVPRYASLEGRICKTREEVRATLVEVQNLALETQARSLGVDEGAIEPHPIIRANEVQASG